MGRDKALLPYRNSTFLNYILSVFLPRLDPVIVVLGCHAEAIRESIDSAAFPEADRERVLVVVNPDYRRGMLSSLLTAIGALPESAEAAMFTLVDHPAVEEETLDRLLAVYRETGAPLIIPQMGDHRGHPVIAARPVLEEIAGLSAEASPKDVIRAHRDETVFVEVEDPGVLRDVDTLAEYERMAGK